MLTFFCRITSLRFLSGVWPSTFNRFMANMPKVYVTYVEDQDSMKISFNYGNSSVSEKWFRFTRRKEELLKSTISRIKLKIADSGYKKKGKRKFTAQVSPEPDDSIFVSLTDNDKTVDGDVENINAWKSGYSLKVGDNLYEVWENPPTVTEVSLPKIIFAGFLIYPKVSVEHANLDECEFTWFRKVAKHEVVTTPKTNDSVVNIKGELWLRLHKGFLYMTTADDLGHVIKVVCTPVSGDQAGIQVEATSTVSLGPVFCPFEERQVYTKEVSDDESIRCVSYNILADLYADSDTARNELFPYCPADALDLGYRKQLYIKEIMGYNSDIICLQEVDRKVFLNDLKPVFAFKGLECIYHEKGGQVAEGLTCMFRSSKFKCIYSEAIILHEVVGKNPLFKNLMTKIVENEKLTERIMQRTTSLQVVLLESVIYPKRRILIGNTHLYFHPNSDNIRLIQAFMCITYLESLLKKYQQEFPEFDIALLLSGDFNSCPEFGVYQLMTKGFVPVDCPDWQSCLEEAVPGMPLSHTLCLDSACGTPVYTNYIETFNGCLDYIFYDKNSFNADEFVPFPTHEQVTENTALPSIKFPSDHIALVCNLKWK